MLVPTPEQAEAFRKLPAQEKINKLKAGLAVLRTAGELHLKILKEHHLSPAPKETGFGYFYPTIESVWQHFDFAINLGDGAYGHYNFFPTRLICENVFRLEYYVTRERKEQNEICLWEMLRVVKRYYDEFGDEEFKDQYDIAVKTFGESGIKYPDITSKEAYKDPFPKIAALIETSRLPTANKFYVHYQLLCESHHGKLLSLYFTKDTESQYAQYSRNLAYLLLFGRWILMLTDKHIGFVTKNQITEAIDNANEFVFTTT